MGVEIVGERRLQALLEGFENEAVEASFFVRKFFISFSLENARDENDFLCRFERIQSSISVRSEFKHIGRLEFSNEFRIFAFVRSRVYPDDILKRAGELGFAVSVRPLGKPENL